MVAYHRDRAASWVRKGAMECDADRSRRLRAHEVGEGVELGGRWEREAFLEWFPLFGDFTEPACPDGRRHPGQ